MIIKLIVEYAGGNIIVLTCKIAQSVQLAELIGLIMGIIFCAFTFIRIKLMKFYSRTIFAIPQEKILSGLQ